MVVLSTTLPDPKQAAYVAGAVQANAVNQDKVSVKQLDQKHQEYDLKAEAWSNLSLLVEGGVLMTKKAEALLKKRPREDPEVYNARRERFTYQNILGTALGWFQAAMFQDDPQFFFYNVSSASDDPRDEVSAEEASFYKDDFLMDCDGNATTFVDFSKESFSNLLTFGVSHVLTDLPSVSGAAPANLLQERELGLHKPFLVHYSPLEVINWKIDRFGAYDWVMIKTTKVEQEFLQKPQEVDTWYYFDKHNFRTYQRHRDYGSVSIPSDADGEVARLIDQGQHALSNVGRVPLRTYRLSNGLWLANRAYLLLMDHLNQDNTLAWSLFMSNLAMPVIIGDVDTTNMVNAEVGYLQFPAGTTYTWSEPEGKSFAASAQRLESLREEAYRSMYLQTQGMSTKSTPQMQSGRSKLVSMVPTHEVLSGMGNDFRRRLQEQLGDVKDARREEDIEPDVRGFDYEVDMSTEEVFAVTSLLSIRIPSETFEKWIYKKIIKSWARDANQKILEKMYDEVDEGPTIEDRLDDDLKNRMNLAAAGMKDAIAGKQGIGGTGLPTPPGRGGSGPTPVDVTDLNAATV